MNLCFLGAARTVTGSRHLLTLPDGRRILLDCGLYQGRRKESYDRNWRFPFEPAMLDAVILSHAHIDHSGNLPNLVKQGYAGPIHCTPATADLCAVMLEDSGHVQETDAAFVNKRRAKRGEPPILPLYTAADASAAMKNFTGHKYYEPFHVFPDHSARCTFFDAGHILGSASISLDISLDGQPLANGAAIDPTAPPPAGVFRLVFSGDIGQPHLPIIRDPHAPPGAHAVIMESTYGDRLHGDQTENEARLREVILRVIERSGKIIVPAFSVGRTQGLVFVLHELWKNGRLPRIPIFVDSPLASRATEVFRRHPECYDEETWEMLQGSTSYDPFGFKALTYTQSADESKALNERPGPCIIISASGMCEAGRILHHLRNNIGDPNNCILITGFMANHTLGRRLVEEQPVVKIFGEEHTRRAEVVVLNSFSAHGDRDDLAAWLDAAMEDGDGGEKSRGNGGRLSQVFLVHGEEQQALALEQHLLDRHPELKIRVPAEGDCFDLALK